MNSKSKTLSHSTNDVKWTCDVWQLDPNDVHIQARTASSVHSSVVIGVRMCFAFFSSFQPLLFLRNREQPILVLATATSTHTHTRACARAAPHRAEPKNINILYHCMFAHVKDKPNHKCEREEQTKYMIQMGTRVCIVYYTPSKTSFMIE